MERVDAGDGVVGGVVQDCHVEAADGPEAVRRKLRNAGLGLGFEGARWTELGGHEPQAWHLGEHSLRRQLVPPEGTSQRPQEMGAPGLAGQRAGKWSRHRSNRTFELTVNTLSKH